MRFTSLMTGPADVVAMPRGLLEDRFRTAPQTLGFRLLVNQLPQQQGRRDFFSGIVLEPGGEARRAWSSTTFAPRRGRA